MASRKGWDKLKPDYRKRLERHGITKQSYTNGASLRKARSHEKTPEHPDRYDHSKFQAYAKTQSDLISQVEAKKKILFGGSPLWNAKKSLIVMKKFYPPLADMRAALKMTRQEMIDAIRENPARWGFLGYKA